MTDISRFADAAFDRVVAYLSTSMCWIREAPAEIARVLKPGAQFVFSEYTRAS